MITPNLFFAGVLVIATSLDHVGHKDRLGLVMVVLVRVYFMMIFAYDMGIW